MKNEEFVTETNTETGMGESVDMDSIDDMFGGPIEDAASSDEKAADSPEENDAPGGADDVSMDADNEQPEEGDDDASSEATGEDASSEGARASSEDKGQDQDVVFTTKEGEEVRTTLKDLQEKYLTSQEIDRRFSALNNERQEFLGQVKQMAEQIKEDGLLGFEVLAEAANLTPMDTYNAIRSANRALDEKFGDKSEDEIETLLSGEGVKRERQKISQERDELSSEKENLKVRQHVLTAMQKHGIADVKILDEWADRMAKFSLYQSNRGMEPFCPEALKDIKTLTAEERIAYLDKTILFGTKLKQQETLDSAFDEIGVSEEDRDAIRGEINGHFDHKSSVEDVKKYILDNYEVVEDADSDEEGEKDSSKKVESSAKSERASRTETKQEEESEPLSLELD